MESQNNDGIHVQAEELYSNLIDVDLVNSLQKAYILLAYSLAKRTSFLDLPAEIREHIYTYVRFPYNLNLKFKSPLSRQRYLNGILSSIYAFTLAGIPFSPLVLACKQTSAEIRPHISAAFTGHLTTESGIHPSFPYLPKLTSPSWGHLYCRVTTVSIPFQLDVSPKLDPNLVPFFSKLQELEVRQPSLFAVPVSIIDEYMAEDKNDTVLNDWGVERRAKLNMLLAENVHGQAERAGRKVRVEMHLI